MVTPGNSQKRYRKAVVAAKKKGGVTVKVESVPETQQKQQLSVELSQAS